MSAACERDAMATPDFDVAIIGYGPVGATLANLLGMSGLTVVVLEREASVYHLPRAVSLDGEGTAPVPDHRACRRSAPRLNTSRNIRHVNAEGQLLVLLARGGIGPEGWNNAYRFYQPELEAILRAGVARFPQVDVRLRVDVFALDEQRTMCASAMRISPLVRSTRSRRATSSAATARARRCGASWARRCRTCARTNAGSCST